MCTSHLRGTTVFFDQNKTSIGAIILGVMDFKTEKKYQYLLNESGSQPAPRENYRGYWAFNLSTQILREN